MLKGHVFSRQLFENQIFALFVNTFLGGVNGISDNYMNSMPVTYSGSNVTIGSGVACIQGRFVEEDTSTTIAAGTDTMYCKLVIEIDLDKTNTESNFQQGAYKIVKSASDYPNLTQTNIVKNNAGVYQYELARFKTTSSGITDFQDMRTFLDFDSIYSEVRQHIADIDSGSLYFEKSNIAKVEGILIQDPNNTENYISSIPYPTDFRQNNTVVLSLMINGLSTTVNALSTGSTFDTSNSLAGTIPSSVKLKENGIEVSARHIVIDNGDYPIIGGTSNPLNYKLVLMKV